jgi:hypothetical protein
MKHTMVVGTTEPQDFELLESGAALDGTGWDVEIEFRESIAGVEAVTVAWLDQSAGTVRVTGAENLTARTYHFRFKLTDGSDDFGYVPNLDTAPNEWRVVRV